MEIPPELLARSRERLARLGLETSGRAVPPESPQPVEDVVDNRIPAHLLERAGRTSNDRSEQPGGGNELFPNLPSDQDRARRQAANDTRLSVFGDSRQAASHYLGTDARLHTEANYRHHTSTLSAAVTSHREVQVGGLVVDASLRRNYAGIPPETLARLLGSSYTVEAAIEDKFWIRPLDEIETDLESAERVLGEVSVSVGPADHPLATRYKLTLAAELVNDEPAHFLGAQITGPAGTAASKPLGRTSTYMFGVIPSEYRRGIRVRDTLYPSGETAATELTHLTGSSINHILDLSAEGSEQGIRSHLLQTIIPSLAALATHR